jgi:hypothetical protein
MGHNERFVGESVLSDFQRLSNRESRSSLKVFHSSHRTVADCPSVIAHASLAAMSRTHRESEDFTEVGLAIPDLGLVTPDPSWSQFPRSSRIGDPISCENGCLFNLLSHRDRAKEPSAKAFFSDEPVCVGYGLND